MFEAEYMVNDLLSSGSGSGSGRDSETSSYKRCGFCDMIPMIVSEGSPDRPSLTDKLICSVMRVGTRPSADQQKAV